MVDCKKGLKQATSEDDSLPPIPMSGHQMVEKRLVEMRDGGNSGIAVIAVPTRDESYGRGGVTLYPPTFVTELGPLARAAQNLTQKRSEKAVLAQRKKSIYGR